MNRLAFVRAQLGPRPGKAAAKALLIDVDALPGSGWRQIDERTWRTGVTNTADDESVIVTAAVGHTVMAMALSAPDGDDVWADFDRLLATQAARLLATQAARLREPHVD